MNAFLRKQTAAKQYSRQVWKYLESQAKQERDRQYQERKRSQQRKIILNEERLQIYE